MTTAPTTVSTWAIDPVHSIAEFAVKHMLVSTVKGRFGSLTGTLSIDEANPGNSSVAATLDVASIDTYESQRDAHLRSDDFFNAEQYPHITFRSTRVERKSDEEWRITGDLSIRDVTMAVTLEHRVRGTGHRPAREAAGGVHGRDHHQPQGVRAQVERPAGNGWRCRGR